jgi:hypothetical protein
VVDLYSDGARDRECSGSCLAGLGTGDSIGGQESAFRFCTVGVTVWWFVLGGPFRSAPSSPAGIAFAAANAALWLLVLLFVVAVVRAVRRMLVR